MSIDSVNANVSAWFWQSQATPQTSDASTPSAPISNAGSVSPANLSTFLQSFSADLEAMLTQASSAVGTAASATTTSSAPASATTATTQTAANQPMAPMHHHHHHHNENGGSDGSMQGAVDQMMTDIGQSLQGGSLTASGISNAASSFATDVMQALQAYGSAASNNSTTALLA